MSNLNHSSMGWNNPQQNDYHYQQNQFVCQPYQQQQIYPQQQFDHKYYSETGHWNGQNYGAVSSWNGITYNYSNQTNLPQGWQSNSHVQNYNPNNITDDHQLNDSVDATSDLGSSINTTSEFDEPTFKAIECEKSASESKDLNKKNEDYRKRVARLTKVELKKFTNIGKEFQIMKRKFQSFTNTGGALERSIEKGTSTKTSKIIIRKGEVSIDLTSESSIDLTLECDDENGYDESDELTKTETSTPSHNHPKANHNDLQNNPIDLHKLPGVTIRKICDDVLSNEKVSQDKNDIAEKQTNNSAKSKKAKTLNTALDVGDMNMEESDWIKDNSLPTGWEKGKFNSQQFYKSPDNTILKTGSEVIAHMRKSETYSTTDIEKFMSSRKKSRKDKNASFKRPAFTNIETVELRKRSKIEFSTENNEDVSQIQEESSNSQKSEELVDMQEKLVLSEEQIERNKLSGGDSDDKFQNIGFNAETYFTDDYQQSADIEKAPEEKKESTGENVSDFESSTNQINETELLEKETYNNSDTSIAKFMSSKKKSRKAKNKSFKRPAFTNIETVELKKRSKMKSEIISTENNEDVSQIQEESSNSQKIEEQSADIEKASGEKNESTGENVSDFESSTNQINETELLEKETYNNSLQRPKSPMTNNANVLQSQEHEVSTLSENDVNNLPRTENIVPDQVDKVNRPKQQKEENILPKPLKEKHILPKSVNEVPSSPDNDTLIYRATNEAGLSKVLNFCFKGLNEKNLIETLGKISMYQVPDSLNSRIRIDILKHTFGNEKDHPQNSLLNKSFDLRPNRRKHTFHITSLETSVPHQTIVPDDNKEVSQIQEQSSNSKTIEEMIDLQEKLVSSEEQIERKKLSKDDSVDKFENIGSNVETYFSEERQDNQQSPDTEEASEEKIESTGENVSDLESPTIQKKETELLEKETYNNSLEETEIIPENV